MSDTPATSRRGIVLAGGTGSRLLPATRSGTKSLLPVYDKPMVYYPLSTLMLAGIREILVVSTPEALPRFRDLLGDGSRWGLAFDYAAQPEPAGIAQALVIAADFLDGRPSALVLGDNLFHGHGLPDLLRAASARRSGATVFAHWVRDPERYGVVELGPDGRPVGIVEKPVDPVSHWAVSGLYFYDGRAPGIAAALEPSDRGELEITDVNRWYLREGALDVERLGRGYAWLDTGTPDSLLQAANFIQTLEARQGMKIACPEEIAWRLGYVDDEGLRALAEPYRGGGYGAYLLGLLEGPGGHGSWVEGGS